MAGTSIPGASVGVRHGAAVVTCDHGIALDRYCASCEWNFYDAEAEPVPTSRAGWLIPLILIAVAVAAIAWRCAR